MGSSPQAARTGLGKRGEVLRRFLHQQVDRTGFNDREAKPLVKSQGRIESLYMQAYRFAGDAGFAQDVLDKAGAEASAAVRRQQRDVNDAEFIGQPGQIQSANGVSVEQDDQKVGGGELLLIVLVLGVELHLEKGAFLRIAPVHQGQFLRARAGIDFAEECSVVRLDGTKCEVAGHARSAAGKLPGAR